MKLFKLKDGTFIPDDYRTNIDANGRLNYFTNLTGRKKTKAYTRLEADLPERDGVTPSWLEIVKINLEWGEEIANMYAEWKVAGIVSRTYLRAKTALYVSAKTEIDKLEDPEDFFENMAIFDYYMALCGVYTLDTVRIDDMLGRSDADYNPTQCTYKDRTGVSMSYYIELVFGVDVKNAVEAMN